MICLAPIQRHRGYDVSWILDTTNCHVLEAHSHLLKDIELIDKYLDRLSEQRLSEITHASYQIASTSKAFAERVGKRLVDQRKARL
jgi:phosphoenolpyruvate-protein kinase (PTS system EI component)